MRNILIALFLCMPVFAYAQKTYLVCVGVGKNNRSFNELPTPRNDVGSLARFYKQYNGTRPFVLLDENATRSNILKVLKKEFSKSTPNDEIIFAYSGHGEDGIISTYNIFDEVIFCSEIQDIMLKAKARRKMMFVHSCHSGSFAKKYKEQGERYKKDSKVLLFLSCRANESSYSLNNDEEHSLFSHFLVKGLKGEADKSGDKKVTARELFNYVGYNVEYTTRYMSVEQHPVMWGKFPDDMVLVYVK